MKTAKLNKSEQFVLSLVSRDGYFTTDPGRRRRENTAAYTLVKKGICTVILRDQVWDETRYCVGGGAIEVSRQLFSTIRIALANG